MDRIEDVNAPKTLEIWIPDGVVLTLLGFLSGAISSVTFGVSSSWDWNRYPLAEAGALLLPGVFFAIAVMIPFRKIVAFWWLKLGFAMAISSVAHATALMMFINLPYDSSRWDVVSNLLTSGSIGALIVGKGLLVILGHPWRYRTLAIMVALGAIGGLFMMFAYLVWQPAVAAPLGSLRRELSAGQIGRGRPT